MFENTKSVEEQQASRFDSNIHSQTMDTIQMIPQKHDFLKKALPLIILGVLILACYLYFFVGISEMVETFQRTNLLILSLAMFFVILDTVFYSLTWQFLLRALSVRTGFRDTFCFAWISIFVDLIIPSESVSGDVAKVYLMSNKSNGEAGKIAASVAFQRIIFGFITLGGFIMGFLAHTFTQPGALMQISNILFTVALTTSFFLTILVLLVIKRNWTERLVDLGLRISEFVSRKRLKREELRPKVTDFLEVFYTASGSFRKQPKKLLIPAISAVLAYTTSILIFFTAFASLDCIVPLSVIMIVYSIGITVQYIPFGVPAELGITEVVMISFFSIFIPSREISAAGTILTRFLTVVFRLIVGFILFEWVGVKAVIKHPETGKSLSA